MPQEGISFGDTRSIVGVPSTEELSVWSEERGRWCRVCERGRVFGYREKKRSVRVVEEDGMSRGVAMVSSISSSSSSNSSSSTSSSSTSSSSSIITTTSSSNSSTTSTTTTGSSSSISTSSRSSSSSTTTTTSSSG
ncbi:hypothetical protein PoB_004757100 [Plakobranchus ocellatus]|uniref:REJ domain-containing protein n=1 Tax=Plakobranchus ocellatus TaxID=259542 RepID=A0AAV4BKZ1_9GAST|nr:hypothetical protein PoB_004757100 [Plakobranchus ocellatus]